MGDFLPRLLDIVDAIGAGVVDAGEMDRLIAAADRFGLVQQHADAHGLHARDHADAVVIAKHAIDRPLEMRAQPGEALQRRVIGAIGGGTIVPRQNRDVVAGARRQRRRPFHGRGAHLDMEIAQMQDTKAIEGGGQIGEDEGVFTQAHAICVAPPTGVEPGRLQHRADQSRGRIQIPDMEELTTPAEDLPLELALDAQALAGVQAAEALFQHRHDIRVHAVLRMARLAGIW